MIWQLFKRKQRNFAELTAFPDIYAQSAWGKLTSPPNKPDRAIIANRNRFARTARLTGCDASPIILELLEQLRLRNNALHAEAYRAERGAIWIVLSVPTGAKTAPRDNFEKGAALHFQNQETHIKRLPCRTAARRWAHMGRLITRAILIQQFYPHTAGEKTNTNEKGE
jgi:hypothetical protein